MYTACRILVCTYAHHSLDWWPALCAGGYFGGATHIRGLLALVVLSAAEAEAMFGTANGGLRP
jgi:hypothetical protein